MFHFKFLLQCAKKMGSVKKPLCPLIHFVTLSLGKVSTDGLFWYTDNPCMVHRRYILIYRRRARCVPMVHFGTPTIHVWYPAYTCMVYRLSMYGAPSIHFDIPSSGKVCTDGSFWYTDHPCTVHGWFILIHRPSMCGTSLIHFGTPTIHVRYTVDSF